MDHDSITETSKDIKDGFEGVIPVEQHIETPDGPDSPDSGMADHQDNHITEETERQRIERLGRERPAKLKSLGAEVFFCYSVIASQFMAVSPAGAEQI